MVHARWGSETEVSPWNKNKIKGKVDQAKGGATQAVARLTGNDKLETEGKVDEAVGKARAAPGHVGQRFGDDAIRPAVKAVKK